MKPYRRLRDAPIFPDAPLLWIYAWPKTPSKTLIRPDCFFSGYTFAFCSTKNLVCGHPHYRKFTGDNAWNPSFAHLAQHRAIFGSPETCVAQIKALQQEGIAYFGCNFAFGGMAHDKVMRSMQLFAEAVMPHFRA